MVASVVVVLAVGVAELEVLLAIAVVVRAVGVAELEVLAIAVESHLAPSVVVVGLGADEVVAHAPHTGNQLHDVHCRSTSGPNQAGVPDLSVLASPHPSSAARNLFLYLLAH